MTVDQISRFYRVSPELIDYGPRRAGDWLLLSSGSGLMLSIMDSELRFRYCLDMDLLPLGANLGEWLVGMERLTGLIAVVGGWWAGRPDFIDALNRLTRPTPTYITLADAMENPFTGEQFKLNDTMAEFLSSLEPAEVHA